jgi:hypothetical protein
MQIDIIVDINANNMNFFLISIYIVVSIYYMRKCPVC